jgi:uncharacterized membrane protein
MGLAILILGLIVFLGGHAATMVRPTRQALVDRLGSGPYKVLYALVAAVGLYLIGYGFATYRATGWIPVWNPPTGMRHATIALMWLSIVCVAAAYLPGNIKRTLKHPMLVGVKLWAFAHLLSNGDLGSMILFAAVLAWAVADRISLKRRSDPGGPPIAVGGWKNDVAAVVVGTLVYLALAFVFHPLVIGVPVLGA